jgi:hypothetical protein
MKNRNEIALPDLKRSLATAAAAQRSEKRRLSSRLVGTRTSRLAATGLAVLAFGGTAMAAGVWNPTLGANLETGAPTTTSDTSAPANLTAQLGVLRRDQTTQDRSAAVEETLAKMPTPTGLRTDSVRALGTNANGDAVILVSAEHFGDAVLEDGKAATIASIDQPVCVYSLPSSLCFDYSELMAGKAQAGSSRGGSGIAEFIGVAPDGVSSVTLGTGSSAKSVAVHDNYWEMQMTTGEYEAAFPHGTSVYAVWHDADGNVVPKH